MKRPTRKTFIAAGALAAALTLAACNTDARSPNDSAGTSAEPTSAAAEAEQDFNAADVMFAQMMIPHHEQAIEMADIVLANEAISPEVSALAEQIKQAQGPEIETLNEWLTNWGAEPADSMAGMDHGDGMMSADDLETLEAAVGDDANRLFLEQMIVHHEGAIEMAQMQVENGSNPNALALAQQIIDSQQIEIDTMQSYLDEMFA